MNTFDWKGFLHRHPKMESELQIDSEHVIVDRNEWMIARERLTSCDTRRIEPADQPKSCEGCEHLPICERRMDSFKDGVIASDLVYCSAYQPKKILSSGI